MFAKRMLLDGQSAPVPCPNAVDGCLFVPGQDRAIGQRLAFPVPLPCSGSGYAHECRRGTWHPITQPELPIRRPCRVSTDSTVLYIAPMYAYPSPADKANGHMDCCIPAASSRRAPRTTVRLDRDAGQKTLTVVPNGA